VAKSTAFEGVITGGNGRMSPAQSNVYYLDVPAGRQDLGFGVTLNTDPNVGIQGVLTAPDGQVSSFQTNLTTGADKSGFQIYRRDPAPGRWAFSLQTPDPSSVQLATPPGVTLLGAADRTGADPVAADVTWLLRQRSGDLHGGAGA